jgi:hypothetical protein
MNRACRSGFTAEDHFFARTNTARATSQAGEAKGELDTGTDHPVFAACAILPLKLKKSVEVSLTTRRENRARP